MPTNIGSKSRINYSTQEMQNAGYDNEFHVPVVETLGYDGAALQRPTADNLQIKAVESGGYNYFCFSAPGTTTATAKWRVFRIDSSGNLMYADGNANYDNAATDPTALTYTYG